MPKKKSDSIMPDLLKTQSKKQLRESRRKMVELQKKAREEIERYNKDLEARARTELQLTVYLDFLVLSATETANNHTISQRIFGGRSEKYKTGQSKSLELEVKPDPQFYAGLKIPVRRIIYLSSADIEAGDNIRVKILKGKEEYERKLFEIPSFGLPGEEDNKKTYLVERQFSETETTTEIQKLNKKKVAKTYRII